MSSDTELSVAVLKAISEDRGWDTETVIRKVASAQEICGFTNPWDAAAFLLKREIRADEMFDEDEPCA